MNTQSIPQDQWQQYLTQVSQQYRGWNATVEVLGADLGDQPVARDLPLQGLTYEKAGSQAGDLLIEMGDANRPYETHRISHPRAVRVADTRPGAETDIEFESADGPTTLLHLRPRPQIPAS